MEKIFKAAFSCSVQFSSSIQFSNSREGIWVHLFLPLYPLQRGQCKHLL